MVTLMFILLKNIIVFILINLFADTSFYMPNLCAFVIIYSMGDDSSTLLIEFLLILNLLLLFIRLLVLPIAYKKLEYSQDFELISQFIHKLKQSWCLKFLVLIITYFSSWCYGTTWFNGGFSNQFFLSLIDGLLGSYLVLFLYWYIEGIVKDKRRKNSIKFYNSKVGRE